MEGGFEPRNGNLEDRYETFKALGPCSGFLLYISIEKDLFHMEAKTTPKTHLRIAPEASSPGEEQAGRNSFALRLPPYKSGSRGTTLLNRALCFACVPGRSFSCDFMCLLSSRKKSEKGTNESVGSLTWNNHEACASSSSFSIISSLSKGFQRI